MWFRTYKSKNSSSSIEIMWFRINTINSVSLRRFVSVPERNACGISWVQNSSTFARLHERSNITLHFLCWNSKTWKGCREVIKESHTAYEWEGGGKEKEMNCKIRINWCGNSLIKNRDLVCKIVVPRENNEPITLALDCVEENKPITNSNPHPHNNCAPRQDEVSQASGGHSYNTISN